MHVLTSVHRVSNVLVKLTNHDGDQTRMMMEGRLVVGCFTPPCPFSDAQEGALAEEDCEKEPWCTIAKAQEQQMLPDHDSSMPKTENNIQTQDHAARLSKAVHQSLEMVSEDQNEVWNAVTLCVNALEKFATLQHGDCSRLASSHVYILQTLNVVEDFWHKANRAHISCDRQMIVDFIIKVLYVMHVKMVYSAQARRLLASA